MVSKCKPLSLLKSHTVEILPADSIKVSQMDLESSVLDSSDDLSEESDIVDDLPDMLSVKDSVASLSLNTKNQAGRKIQSRINTMPLPSNEAVGG